MLPDPQYKSIMESDMATFNESHSGAPRPEETMGERTLYDADTGDDTVVDCTRGKDCVHALGSQGTRPAAGSFLRVQK